MNNIMNNLNNIYFLEFIEKYFSKYKFRYGNINNQEKILYLFNIYGENTLMFCYNENNKKIENYLISIFQQLFQQINDGDFNFIKLNIPNTEYNNISEFEFNMFIDNCIYSIMDYFGNLKEIEKDRLYVCLSHDIVFMPIIEYNDMFTGEYENNSFNHHMKILGLKEIHNKIFCDLK